MRLYSFVAAHADLFWSLAAVALGFLKVARWGQAHARALAVVMQAVEDANDQKIKDSVAGQQAAESTAVRDVISSTAQLVDPRQANPSPIGLFARIAVSKIL